LNYAEGSSWQAYEANDVVVLDKNAVPTGIPFTFGCQTAETIMFQTQLENGIMGITMDETTLLAELVRHGVVEEKVVALCMDSEEDKAAGAGGSMTLGGFETSHHLTPLRFTSLLRPTGKYVVNLVDIRVGNQSINVPDTIYRTAGDTIVDSGTTNTYLPMALSEAFDHAFSTFTPAKEVFTSLSRSVAEACTGLPDLTFHFADDVVVRMPCEHYMECRKGTCSPTIHFENNAGTVLGANFMTGHDVVFDWEHGKIGFAEANCNFQARR